ncbi:hypothetical protein H9N25_19505 [Pedobacter riviphilus]|uniref:Uncharacterized protein n=1 Tax=Pedobacter riviphilus TaxID=2766984 RepID=A0ABX6TEZ9_9SPHI|nr:hypothetical protein [Pedobacter riviphilus]QNR84078.1 hypothetical protein H9N25_19505 [Pedobacter riviphilus]
MFKDYKKDLLKFYQIKEKNDNLSENLKPLGRERLRTECVEVFQKKNAQKDKDLIRPIFDPKRQHEDLERCIERYDLNKFRPLISFLTIEGRNIRNDKFVKLFAWLLDFPPHEEWREFDKEKKEFIFEEAAKKHKKEEDKEDPNDDQLKDESIDEIKNDDKKTSSEEDSEEDQLKDEEGTDETTNHDKIKNEEDLEEDQNDDEPEDEEETEEDNHKPIYVPRFSIHHIAIASIILLFIGSTSFVEWENTPTTIRTPNLDEKCMYWDEDHYEPVKCNTQIAVTTIVPLNLNSLKKQRKINLPDTLTSYSIGKVWYKGHGKDHEFFTDSGAYPLDTQRVLKPLSNTILTKYTSNYRYLLTRLVWFLCAAFFVGICGIWASRLKKEVKQPVEEGETDNAVNFYEAEFAQQ